MSYTTIISIDELAARMPTKDLVIFDCRFDLKDTEAGRKAYWQSHLPGAHYAHLDDDLSGTITPGVTGRHPLPDPQEFMDWLGSRGVSSEKQVVVYDQWHGGVAARLWWMLQWIGHHDVAVLDGGWRAYEAADLPVEAGIPERVDRTYPGKASPEMITPLIEVSKSNLVDARTAVRFRGIEEPIDPIAGHITGAQNLPFLENLLEDGSWRSPDDLRERFEPLFSGENRGELTCYCGSGVTACHNILAMEYAGLGMPKLYPGSWSEWILDPERPMTTMV